MCDQRFNASVGQLVQCAHGVHWTKCIGRIGSHIALRKEKQYVNVLTSYNFDSRFFVFNDNDDGGYGEGNDGGGGDGQLNNIYHVIGIFLPIFFH